MKRSRLILMHERRRIERRGTLLLGAVLLGFVAVIGWLFFAALNFNPHPNHEPGRIASPH